MRHTHLLSKSSLAFFMIVMVGGQARADIITFIHTGSGSGSLGSTSFGLSNFTITATANTDNRTSLGFGWYLDHVTATITIGGLGTYDFITATRTFVNNGNQLVGFSRAGGSGADLFDGPSDPAFSDWEMLMGIGPVAGTGSLMQWWDGIDTTGGSMYFNNGTSASTFTATIPTPGVLALLGVAGVVGRRRRRRC